MKENYYFYLILDGTTPNLEEEGHKLIDLITKYETPEVEGEWTYTGISLNPETQKILWAHHVSVDPKDLGQLVQTLANIKSARLTVTKTKYNEIQLYHLLNTPSDKPRNHEKPNYRN